MSERSDPKAPPVAYTNGAGYRSDSLLTIGAASEDSNRFTGYLDRIRYDQRALSAAELDFNTNVRITSWNRPVNGQFTFSWASVGSARYRVQYTTNLSQPIIDIVRDAASETDPSPLGQASTMSYTDTAPNNVQRLYRVIIVP